MRGGDTLRLRSEHDAAHNHWHFPGQYGVRYRVRDCPSPAAVVALFLLVPQAIDPDGDPSHTPPWHPAKDEIQVWVRSDAKFHQYYPAYMICNCMTCCLNKNNELMIARFVVILTNCWPFHNYEQWTIRFMYCQNITTCIHTHYVTSRCFKCCFKIR